MELSKLQTKILNIPENKVVVMASAASGKALAHGSSVYGMDGKIKIEDVRIGDKIYGEDGIIHTVEGVYPQGKKKEFVVHFANGTLARCCEEHLWTIIGEDGKYITKTLGELKEEMDKKNIPFSLPSVEPINYTKKLINKRPYLYGRNIMAEEGIEEEYLISSVSDRVGLLKGIIDSDYSEVYREGDLNPHLIKDIVELCASLGIIISKKDLLCTRRGVLFLDNFDSKKFSSNSTFQCSRFFKNYHHEIIGITTEDKEVEMTCITVDNPSSLFLINGYVPTHNTAVMTAKVSQLLEKDIDPKEIAVITFTNMAAEELRSRLDSPFKEGIFIGTIHSLANSFLRDSGIDTRDYLDKEDFDGLFRLVQQNPQCIRPITYLLLDEAQDSGDEQFSFIFDMIKPKNFFICGDLRQCQPGNTKIRMANGRVERLDKIYAGDKIIGYDKETRRIVENCVVDEVECRTSGQDESIFDFYTADNRITSYTENHRAYAKLNIRKDTYWLCITKADNRNDDSAYELNVEHIDRNESITKQIRNKSLGLLWVLSAGDDLNKILNVNRNLQQIIDYRQDTLGEKVNVKSILKLSNRNYNMPLYTNKENTNLDGFEEFRACNLVNMDIDFLSYAPAHFYKKNTVHVIESSSRIGTQEPVYSLKVSPTSFYVADGIVTHNSIYGFRGGNPDLLKNLAAESDVRSCSLNENYRNGYGILRFAKGIIRPTGLIDDSISVCDYNGEVIEMPYNQMKVAAWLRESMDFKNWAILTRTNAEATTLAGVLASQAIPCESFKQKDLTKTEMDQRMKNNSVKILTIHSAKGLEWDNVIVVGAKFFSVQERNVSYVAATRAKKKLYWLSGGVGGSGYKKKTKYRSYKKASPSSVTVTDW